MIIEDRCHSCPAAVTLDGKRDELCGMAVLAPAAPATSAMHTAVELAGVTWVVAVVAATAAVGEAIMGTMETGM